MNLNINTNIKKVPYSDFDKLAETIQILQEQSPQVLQNPKTQITLRPAMFQEPQEMLTDLIQYATYKKGEIEKSAVINTIKAGTWQFIIDLGKKLLQEEINQIAQARQS